MKSDFQAGGYYVENGFEDRGKKKECVDFRGLAVNAIAL